MSIHCPHCKLNQYLTSRNQCRRCKKPLQGALVLSSSPVKRKVPVAGRDEELYAFGAAVAYFRRSKRMTQLQMSMKMGDAFRGHLAKIECGVIAPSIRTVFAICRALGVAPSVLFEKIESAAESK